jgi:outer membrane protein assembly factor BamB
MSSAGDRQQVSRTLLRVAVGALVLVIAGLGVRRYLDWDEADSDPSLIAQLQTARLSAAPSSMTNGDWPQWRGPGRDGVSLETGLLTDWPPGGPPRLWTAPAGPGYSSLAVFGSRLYTMLKDGGSEVVVCLDADSGKEVWRRPYACDYKNDQGSGPRSTPSVDDDRVYTVGATGIFHCLNAQTGEVLWRHDLLDEFHGKSPTWGVSFSPLVVGDLAYTMPGGSKQNGLAAFNKVDGKLIWHNLDDPAGYSSPVLCKAAGKVQILFFTAVGLVSVSPSDGSEYWRFPWKTPNDVNAATPVCVDDYVFLSSDYGIGCALLKVEAKGPDKHVAKRVYKNKRLGDNHASNVYYNEHIYGFHDGRQLVCMDFRTGDVKWQENGYGHGSLVAAEGYLIVLGDGGKLALVEATPSEYREKASLQLSGSRYWSMPVLANRRLYVRDEREIVCWDLAKQRHSERAP